MVQCQICKKEFNQINYVHLNFIHNISIEEYKNKFPNSKLLSNETWIKRSNIRKGKHHTEESKQKNREKHLGKNIGNKYALGYKPWNKGLTKLDDERLRIIGQKSSYRNKGRQSPMMNKHHTENSIEKIRIANLGKIHTEETKLKQSIAHEGEKSYRYKGGISFDPYCPKFNNRKKEEIRNKYGRKCYYCGRNEKDNITKSGKLRKLHVHHIDLDKEQGCNVKGFKLIPLCSSCHMRLHHDKIKLEVKECV